MLWKGICKARLLWALKPSPAPHLLKKKKNYSHEEYHSQRCRYNADLVDYENEEEDYCNPFPCEDDAYYTQLLEDKLTMKERYGDEYHSLWDNDDDGFAYNPDY